MRGAMPHPGPARAVGAPGWKAVEGRRGQKRKSKSKSTKNDREGIQGGPARSTVLANRDKKKYEDRFERSESRSRPDEDRPRGPETTFRSLGLLDRILQMSSSEDPRLVQHLLLLRHQIEV